MSNKALPKFSNVIQLMQYFSDENVCLEHLKQMRWKDGVCCPHCGCRKIYEFSDGKRYKCSDCRKQFTAKVGSIFENSKMPLRKWFVAIYLVTAQKKGISSLQLSRDLGMTQKNAWFLLHRLRHASNTDAFNAPWKNTVEADENYIGGKEMNKHNSKKQKGTQGRSTKTQTPILAVIERKGFIKAAKSESVDTQAISRFLTNNVVLGSKLMTDEYRIFQALKWLYNHNYVKHANGEYGVNKWLTYTLGGFFSLFKRSIVGIYHSVSAKYLDNYLNEATFHYNSMEHTDQDWFNRLLIATDNRRLTYQAIIANA